MIGWGLSSDILHMMSVPVTSPISPSNRRRWSLRRSLWLALLLGMVPACDPTVADDILPDCDLAFMGVQGRVNDLFPTDGRADGPAWVSARMSGPGCTTAAINSLTTTMHLDGGTLSGGLPKVSTIPASKGGGKCAVWSFTGQGAPEDQDFLITVLPTVQADGAALGEILVAESVGLDTLGHLSAFRAVGGDTWAPMLPGPLLKGACFPAQ